MPESANTPDDFPVEQFDLVAFCDACGHSAAIDRARIPPGLPIPELPECRLLRHREWVAEESANVARAGTGPVASSGAASALWREQRTLPKCRCRRYSVCWLDLLEHVNTKGITVSVVFATIIDEDSHLVISGQGKLCLIELAPRAQRIAEVAGATEGDPGGRAGR
jgi:hypothetical protein